MLNRRQNFMLCMISLAVGGMLYLLFRETSYVSVYMARWIDLSVLHSTFGGAPGFFRYLLPDMLWSFSLSCGMLAIMEPEGRCYWGITGFVLGSVWELLQYCHLITGTADGLDLLMYFTGSLLSIIINKRRMKDEKV